MRIDIKGDIVPNGSKRVYDFFKIDCVTPKMVNDKIELAAKSNEKIDVYINSGGGEIFSGTEIRDALQGYAGEVNIHVTGLAASAASIIACAGHSDISPTSLVMIHNVASEVCGDYHTMDKESDILQTANKAMAAAYIQKTGMTEEEALQLMDRETWLTAQEAVDLKLIDGIAEPKNTMRLVAASTNVLSAETLEKMKNMITENELLNNKVERLKNYILLKEKSL